MMAIVILFVNGPDDQTSSEDDPTDDNRQSGADMVTTLMPHKINASLRRHRSSKRTRLAVASNPRSTEKRKSGCEHTRLNPNIYRKGRRPEQTWMLRACRTSHLEQTAERTTEEIMMAML